LSDILLVETDPSVRVVRLRVRAGGVEHAFDRVRGTGNIGPAFDGGERRNNEHEQDGNDADDDQQFEERKGAGAPKLRKVQRPEVRTRKSDRTAAATASGTKPFAGFLGKHRSGGGARIITEARTVTSNKWPGTILDRFKRGMAPCAPRTGVRSTPIVDCGKKFYLLSDFLQGNFVGQLAMHPRQFALSTN